ncbi:MAG TPA: glycosyltransferase [Nitriliruptorales bacterium]|nr:glycosyltransferase [Nitriliruptorales bacterium]
MRLLYLIDSLGRGGAESSLVALAPAFLDRGLALEVAYLGERDDLRRQLEDAGVPVVSLAGPGGRPGWIRRARRLIAARRPDLVHTTLFEADIVGRCAARAAGVRVVSSLVTEIYGPDHRADPRLHAARVASAWAVDALTARLVARFHAISHHVADVMGPRLRIPRDRIDVVPRGRDPGRLGEPSSERRARARRAIGAGGTTPVVLAVARHEYQKGLDLLVDAFTTVVRTMPEARLVVAGREGAQSADLRAAVARAGTARAVRFLGVRDDVADLLCAADVFACPSRWEGLSGAVVEAMAMGTPIVASDIPPVREALGGESNARLVPHGRPDALAQAVLATLNDPRDAQQRARRARARFSKHFTIDAVADRMLEFYRRAATSAPTRPPTGRGRA